MRLSMVFVVAASLSLLPACRGTPQGIGMSVDLAPGQHAVARAIGGGKLRVRNLGPGDAEVAFTSDPDANEADLRWESLRVFDVPERRVRGDLTARVRALESTTGIAFGVEAGTSLDAKALPPAE